MTTPTYAPAAQPGAAEVVLALAPRGVEVVLADRGSSPARTLGEPEQRPERLATVAQ